jgi:hypothetical protein
MEKPQASTKEIPASVETGPLLLTPNGRDELIAAFGNIYQYIGADGQLEARWQADFLTKMPLPFPLRLAWDPQRVVTLMTCHKRMTAVYTSTFTCIQQRGLQATITSFGGCFAFRPQRTGSKLSAHSWGIAIDLNPESNRQGTVGNMNVDLVEIFCAAGFEWGGNWNGSSRDPMHFQFCTGY